MRVSHLKYQPYFRKGISALLFFSLLILPSFLFSQNTDNLRIEKVPEEGLTNDYVVCINQDTNGFMWFGTREGLFRYDGYSFKAFKNLPGDSTSLVNNVIITLYPEKNNLSDFASLSAEKKSEIRREIADPKTFFVKQELKTLNWLVELFRGTWLPKL